MIRRNIGIIWPIGITRKGTFYYSLSTRMYDAYIATLDLRTGKVLAPSKKANKQPWAFAHTSDFSPDGNYLLYSSRRGSGVRVIIIRFLKTGEERELVTELNGYSFPCWFPDGRSILVYSLDKKNRQGFYQIDAQTGDVTPIVQQEPGIIFPWKPVLSPDGKTIFYKRSEMAKNLHLIIERDIETGQEKELFRAMAPSALHSLILSPDGLQLVFVLHDKEKDTLKVIPATGGESRELLTVKHPESIANGSLAAWMPDGNQILFGKKLQGKMKTELWRISVDGGDPQKLGLAMEGLRQPHMHPDGQRIGFISLYHKGEVWVMENFLPEEKRQR